MDMLEVRGGRIVDRRGNQVRLRGTCVGGWMNMENFINGYPGSEHGIRAAVAEVLGPEKGQFFFDRLLEYFFAEDDIKFLHGLGATVVRLPVNYRHFELDSAPFEYLEAGFARLDKMVELCARGGMYVIIDLHAVQGWQNSDWHSDNGNRHAMFWTFRQFQDRFYALWREIARRYKGNPAVAGYNVMNEPVTAAPDGRLGNMKYKADWAVMNRIYRRVVEEIRAIDPEHIVFLEGDYYSSLFAGLEAPFAPNLVYSSHNYNAAGFGPGAYPGTFQGEKWDRSRQAAILAGHEGMQFSKKHNVPLWVGEFGAVYNGPATERPDRLHAMDDQVDVYEEAKVHWTTWTYKDVGVMGWVELDPESEYMRLIAPVIRAKKAMDTDLWMGWLPSTPARGLVQELARLTQELIPDENMDAKSNARYAGQAALDNYVGALMQPMFAKAFQGMNETQLDRALQSFAFRSCKPNQGLVDLLKKHMARPA
jgi:endoglucanase